MTNQKPKTHQVKVTFREPQPPRRRMNYFTKDVPVTRWLLWLLWANVFIDLVAAFLEWLS